MKFSLFIAAACAALSSARINDEQNFGDSVFVAPDEEFVLSDQMLAPDEEFDLSDQMPEAVDKDHLAGPKCARIKRKNKRSAKLKFNDIAQCEEVQASYEEKTGKSCEDYFLGKGMGRGWMAATDESILEKKCSKYGGYPPTYWKSRCPALCLNCLWRDCWD